MLLLEAPQSPQLLLHCTTTTSLPLSPRGLRDALLLFANAHMQRSFILNYT